MRKLFLPPQPRTGPNTVLYYKLWAGFTSAAKVFDYSLNGNTGTVVGTSCLPTYPGFYSDGSADYINCGHAASLDLQTALTACAWVYLDSSWAAAGHICTKRSESNPAGSGWQFFLGGDRILNSSGAAGEITGTTALDKSKWYLVALTITGTALKMYINGALEKSGTTTALGNQTAMDATIGCRWNDFTGGTIAYPFFGKIGDALLFNRVLTAAELLDMYNLTKWRYGR